MSLHPAAAIADLIEGEPHAVTVEGTDVVLVKIEDEIHCIRDLCSHGQVPLSEGDVDVDDVTIECYLHGSTFDLRTGVPQCLPATDPVSIYPTKVEGDTILVELPNQGDKA